MKSAKVDKKRVGWLVFFWSTCSVSRTNGRASQWLSGSFALSSYLEATLQGMATIKIVSAGVAMVLARAQECLNTTCQSIWSFG